MAVNNDTKKVEFVVSLKHLTNFWRTSDTPLINCEVSLTLSWPKTCVLTDMITYDVVLTQGNVPEILAINAPTNATFFKRQQKTVFNSSHFIS